MIKKEYYKEWAKTHPENIKRARKKYLNTKKGRATKNKMQRRFYHNNKERLLPKRKQWQKTDKGKMAAKHGRMKGTIRDNRMISEFKLHGCSICGYDKCNRSLCFHHIESENKLFNLNVGNMGLSDERLLNEFYKCILICKNCHGEIHAL